MRMSSVVQGVLLAGVVTVIGCRDDPSGPTSLTAPPPLTAEIVRTVVTPNGGWRITEKDLPMFPGFCGALSEATAINNVGWVVGMGQRLGDFGCTQHAFLLRPGQPIRDITPRAIDATALGVNDHGTAVGEADGRAFRWSQKLGFQYIGGSGSRATALNNVGQIVGTHTTSSGVSAFLWTRAGGMQDLAPMTAAYAIDDQGQIAGTAVFGSGPPHAVVRMDDGTLVDLGTRGAGAEARGWWSLNPIGNFYDNLGDELSGHAFIKLDDGTFQPVRTLGGPGNAALEPTDATSSAGVGPWRRARPRTSMPTSGRAHQGRSACRHSIRGEGSSARRRWPSTADAKSWDGEVSLQPSWVAYQLCGR